MQLPGYYIHQDYSGMVNFNRYVGNAKGIGGVSSLYFHMARMSGLVPRKTQRSRKSIDIRELAHHIHCVASKPLSVKPTSVVSLCLRNQLVFSEVPSYFDFDIQEI